MLSDQTFVNYRVLSSGPPTCWFSDPMKQPDSLDFFVISGIGSAYTEVKPIYDLSLEHTPLIASIRSPAIPFLPTFKIFNQKYLIKIFNKTNVKETELVEDAIANMPLLLIQNQLSSQEYISRKEEG